MIDFELTKTDEELLAEARVQATFARKYARHYEANEHELIPRELPEARGRINPAEERLQRLDETSGKALLEALLFLEHFRGDVVPLRFPKLTFGNWLLDAVGTPEQKERWSKLAICIGITEPGAGSDPSRIRTTATFDEAKREWSISGEKIFITYAGESEAAIVMAKVGESGGRSLFSTFLIEKGTPGFSVTPQLKKMGIRAEDTAGLVMEDVRVPALNEIAGDLKETLRVFNNSRPIVAACALGVSRAALDFTTEKLREAGIHVDYASGSAIQSSVAARLLRLEALYEATWLTVVRAKWLEDRDGGPMMIEASMAKAKGGRASRTITQECLELLGPLGLSEEFLVEKWFRDARIFDIYEGPGEVQRIIIARQLLGYSRRELQ